MDAALEGIDVMYLACAAGPCQAGLESLAIDAARRNGARRVVKLSAFDAHDANLSDFCRWNGIAETHLRNSGLAWTILRPTAFSQSLDPGRAGSLVWRRNRGSHRKGVRVFRILPCHN